MCIHCKSHICKSLWIKASAKCKCSPTSHVFLPLPHVHLFLPAHTHTPLSELATLFCAGTQGSRGTPRGVQASREDCLHWQGRSSSDGEGRRKNKPGLHSATVYLNLHLACVIHVTYRQRVHVENQRHVELVLPADISLVGEIILFLNFIVSIKKCLMF